MNRDELIALIAEAVAKLRDQIQQLKGQEVIERVIEPQIPADSVVERYVSAYLAELLPQLISSEIEGLSADQILPAVQAYLTANPPPKGDQGERGEQGEKGEQGDQGLPGQDGISITGAEIFERGLILSLSNGDQLNVGTVVGADGQDGQNGQDGKDGTDGQDGQDGREGRGIESAQVNRKGHLILTMTDGTEIDAGLVKGRDGITQTIVRNRKPVQVIGGDQDVPFDDYTAIEYLPDAQGNGEVQTFVFASEVAFVVIEMVSTLNPLLQADAIEAQEGRATTGAQEPALGLGAVLKHEQPISLLVKTNTVKVLAPNNTRITIYGKRR